jgi:hypothetical protein
MATFIAVPVAAAVLLISAFAFDGFGPGDPEPAATGPVTMAERELGTDAFVTCELLIADLPDTLAGKARRPVSAGSQQNAAYGDPPIMVECGTTVPPIGLTDEVFNLAPPGAEGGVCWYPVYGEDSTAWTTVDRTVPVTVTVPGDPDASGQSVIPFSAPVGENIPPRDADDIPTGCGETPPTD